ncbi:MAG TPA: hypothetical protein VD927_15005 [Chryseosolibacter sp.]|nr:hypothetical protein [Chryseosolibacter sp.]
MKIFLASFFAICVLAATGFKSPTNNEVELSCMKMQKSTNTCHFNFKIDGARYRFVDNGCRFSKKKEAILEKAQKGNLALAKDWKLECAEIKPEKETSSSPDF